MRKFVALLSLFVSFSVFAQDVIVKKDGSTIISKVYEVGRNEVKYKKYSNLNGPIYSIAKKEVMAINYENGDKDDFDKTRNKDVIEWKNEYIKPNKNYPNMYSNISFGYTNFAINSNGATIIDCSYNSNGFAVEYNYGIKPIKKIDLYIETGIKATYTFAKDVFVVYVDDDMEMDGSFRYFSISMPLNFKYKFNIPNSDFCICPYIGMYFKRNVIAKQKNSWSEIDFISGAFPSVEEDGVSIVIDDLKYQKNQFGWQVGLSLEYKNYNIAGYYGRDFRSVVTNKNSIFNKYYGSQFGISLGYRFNMFK